MLINSRLRKIREQRCVLLFPPLSSPILRFPLLREPFGPFQHYRNYSITSYMVTGFNLFFKVTSPISLKVKDSFTMW